MQSLQNPCQPLRSLVGDVLVNHHDNSVPPPPVPRELYGGGPSGSSKESQVSTSITVASPATDPYCLSPKNEDGISPTSFVVDS